MNKWVIFPTGRWATTVEAHGGHLALHAWPGGEWAITRGNSTTLNPAQRDPIVTRYCDEGRAIGEDLNDAMRIAEHVASDIAANEVPGTQHQATLF